MSIVSLTGSAPTTASLVNTITIPTVATGDLGIALFHANSSLVTFTAPTGWTTVASNGPLGGSNCETYLCTKNSPFSSSDSGGSLTGNYSGGSAPRYAIDLAVVRGVTFGTPVLNADDTADATLHFGTTYTPTADSEDIIVLGGLTTISAAGSYTITTTPSGWTKAVDLNGAYASASNTGCFILNRTLGAGTGGNAQTIADGTASKSVRMNSWTIPLITAVPTASWRRVTTAGTTSIPLALLIKS